MQKTQKARVETCEGCFVADAPVERGFRPTSAAQFGPSPRVRSELKLKRPPFLGH